MNSLLNLESYLKQVERWPSKGKHILAHFDDNSIIVYQAFNDKIANAAVATQNFNSKECIKSGYSLNRMSWIKTNFLWMMYRSGWATKPNQEKILAIRITRSGFEEILSKCILSSMTENEEDLKSSKKCSRNDEVRLQWDPDHHPSGAKVTDRRAIQIGLRNDILKKFCNEFILNIYDITDLVVEQRENCVKKNDYSSLMLPIENVYKISNDEIVKNIQLDDDQPIS